MRDPLVWIEAADGSRREGYDPRHWIDPAEKDLEQLRRRCDFHGASFDKMIARLRAKAALDIAGLWERSGYAAARAKADALRHETYETGKALEVAKATTPAGFIAQLAAMRNGARYRASEETVEAMIAGARALRGAPPPTDAVILALLQDWAHALRHAEATYSEADEDTFGRACGVARLGPAGRQAEMPVGVGIQAEY
jgi:hypothetical protein